MDTTPVEMERRMEKLERSAQAMRTEWKLQIGELRELLFKSRRNDRRQSLGRRNRSRSYRDRGKIQNEEARIKATNLEIRRNWCEEWINSRCFGDEQRKRDMEATDLEEKKTDREPPGPSDHDAITTAKTSPTLAVRTMDPATPTVETRVKEKIQTSDVEDAYNLESRARVVPTPPPKTLYRSAKMEVIATQVPEVTLEIEQPPPKPP